MRIVLVAGLALALSACGGGETETTEMNTMEAGDSMMDRNSAMDPDMAGNMAMDPSGQNIMMDDYNMMTNDPSMMMNNMNTSVEDTNRVGL